MRRNRQNTAEVCSDRASATAAVRPLAAEEIRAGDYLVILRETFEYPAVLLRCDPLQPHDDAMLRFSLIPDLGGLPRRVQATYLPYVLVRGADGRAETLDVRRQQLARVPASSARIIWRTLRRARKKRL